MSISASMVKTLRERTGAGMMECKKALIESNGDIEAAIEAMRKSGALKAEKKAGRTAAEGAITIAQNDSTAVMVETNAETDFVGRDENFKNFAQAVVDTALANNIDNIDVLSTATIVGGSEDIETARANLIAKIGENIQLRRIANVSIADHGGVYLHGGRIGVLVSLSGGSTELAKDLAMHIAASNPVVVDPSDVPEDLVTKEREIFSAQAQESGKPAEIIEKMIEGRISKFLNEVSLVGQPFVKDPNTKVGQLLKSNNAKVEQFIRFEVGEGIEKKVDDFASEVMSQVQSSSN